MRVTFARPALNRLGAYVVFVADGGKMSESAKQLAAFASIRAVVVFPVPLGPQKIYA